MATKKKKPKARFLSVRLRPEEWEYFDQEVKKRGYKSASDYVRTMLGLIAFPYKLKMKNKKK